MTTVFADSYKIYVYTTTWVDLTADIISPISVRWGISGNSALDRIADTGVMTFTLNNLDGTYTPGLGGALAGWQSGLRVKLTVIYDGILYTRFYGTIGSINLFSFSLGNYQAEITVVDGVDFAAKTPFSWPTILVNQPPDVAILDALIPVATIYPMYQDIDLDGTIFPSMFDSVQARTTVYAELAKITNSALGRLYFKKTEVDGETIVFETALHRKGYDPLDIYPIGYAEAGRLLMEDGGYLLLETGDNIVLDEVRTAEILATMQDLEFKYGDRILNSVNVSAYPKRTDTGLTVIFNLDHSLEIASNETIIFRGRFNDLTGGGATVNGTNMAAPVATTDYLMNTESDGTGTNTTADVVISVVYNTEGGTYTIENTSGYTGYIIFLQARGYGIYSYNKIDTNVEDATSIIAYGYQRQYIDQKYEQDLANGILQARGWVEMDREPRNAVNTITFIANRNDTLFSGWLNLDVGSLIHVTETNLGIDEHEYIQEVSFEIYQGGLVKVRYIVKSILTLALGLVLISGQFGEFTSTPVDFGYLPQASDIVEKTYSAWIYPDAVGGVNSALFGSWSNDGASSLVYKNDKSLELYQKGTTGPGIWVTAADSVPLGAWIHVAATRDSSVAANLPILYINGVSFAVTETSAQIGATVSEKGSRFIMGENNVMDRPYMGKMKDVRVYNRILTAAEIASLAAGTDITDGLVFHGPCLRPADATIWDGVQAVPPITFIDDVNFAIGDPGGVKVHVIP